MHHKIFCRSNYAKSERQSVLWIIDERQWFKVKDEMLRLIHPGAGEMQEIGGC